MSQWRRDRIAGAAPATSRAVRLVQGSPDAQGRRVAVVASEFNDSIVADLLEGAVKAWTQHGGAEQELLVARVPGAFELPVVARKLARSGNYDAVVALGCVIRGDTPHFDFVAGECARGLQRVSTETGVPVIFGVLTVENEAQARERAAPAGADKGGEAMHAALAMADLIAQL